MSRQSKGNHRRLRYESLEDRRMLSMTYQVINTNNSGAGSLRDAVALADNLPGKDEIVFAASMFTSGTPVISLSSAIQVDDPVKIHSPLGEVIITGSAQEALLLKPALSQGINEDFEISNLRIQNFKYGIRVTDSGGNPDATIEGVNIVNNIFLDNEIGIYFERSLVPFEIRDNQILGILAPSADPEAGIWIENLSIQTNTFNPVIDNNVIGDNEDYGIIVFAAKIPNLVISGNRIGADFGGNAAPNGVGILVQDHPAPFDDRLTEIDQITGNEIVFNGTGISIIDIDQVTIDGSNDISFNTGNGIEISHSPGQMFRNSSDHVIAGNQFRSNGGSAVAIGESTADLSERNRVSNNFFTGNGALPIDILGDGIVNPNDSQDIDTGPNKLLNYPVIVESGIVDEGTQWKVPIDFESISSGDYIFEFYKYNPTLEEYSFIRSETRNLPLGDLQEDFFFQKGTEINSGDFLAALAIWDMTSTSIVVGDTSELVGTSLPLVNDTTPPTITDVILSGSDPTWTRAPYSFADIVLAGEQFKPIFTEGVDTLQIQFSENVTFGNNGAELKLRRKNGVEVTGITFDGITGTTATWTFAAALPSDKLAIHLSDLTITDASGNQLDGDWENDDNDVAGQALFVNTPDDITDDTGEAFSVGDGLAGSLNNEFRFHFAYLPGDYDGDGVVAIGSEGATGDGNGDGLVDSNDLTVGTNGQLLSLRGIGGADFGSTSLGIVEDEIVNEFDFAVWDNGFGTGGSGVPGDVDGDGDVDGVDFFFWQQAFGTFSAWYVPTTGSGLASALVGPAAPQVMNVIISGSSSLHSDFSFDTVDGSGSQLATVPVGGADTVSIVFSEGVNVSAGSLIVIGMTTANMPTLADFSYDTATNTATWRFEGWALGDNYLISLADSVTDVEGNLLDGEWTNPASISTVNAAVSEFPSGDGNPGGRFNFFMTLLAGDANLDGVVNISDFGILATNWGGTNLFFQDGDFNGDGAVDGNDFNSLAFNWGTNLQDIWALADLDGDNDIDADDLDTITANFGMTGATWADGDLNGDGSVTIEDLDLAFLQFGLGLDLVA